MNSVKTPVTWASAEIFPGGGQRQHFANSYQVADDAMQMYVHETLNLNVRSRNAQWRTQKIFMRRVFIQWHMVVICIWCAVFITTQFDVIFMFPN